MCVAKSHRKNGVAKIMMNTLITHISNKYKDVDDIVLSTSEMQKPAMRLYQRHGFKEMCPVEEVLHLYSRVRFLVHYYHLPLKH